MPAFLYSVFFHAQQGNSLFNCIFKPLSGVWQNEVSLYFVVWTKQSSTIRGNQKESLAKLLVASVFCWQSSWICLHNQQARNIYKNFLKNWWNKPCMIIELNHSVIESKCCCKFYFISSDFICVFTYVIVMKVLAPVGWGSFRVF